jgi:allophanate hydrolase subunit 2
VSRSVSVEAVGPQALVVDRGRAGWAHIGVPGAGALDGPAHALAQRLVGNDPSDAGL